MNYYRNIITITALFLLVINSVNAQSIDELKAKIDDRNDAISKLEQEIKQYQSDIEKLGKEKDSLSNTIKSLDISRKKLEADTKITENKIAAKNLEIKELSLQIGDKSERIDDGKVVISKSLYNIYQANSMTIIESLLGKKSFSDLWRNSDELATLQASMQNRIKELSTLKVNLEENKKLTEKKKLELVALTDDLKNQTKIVADNVKEKNTLLVETKNTEANYNKLLLVKQAQKEAFEREVSDLEATLKIVIDPNSLPSTERAVLRYPLDSVRITQYFGNTDYATKNPQIYSRGVHPGIDLAALIGTPVKASMTGVVVGLGDMDSENYGKCSGRAYGRWVMLKHENGLSTLYAHLSFIKVSNGQKLIGGQVLGYSGKTGAATGPHLHFGVYATQGIRITKLTKEQSKSCNGVLYPLSDPSAYLNPLSYL